MITILTLLITIMTTNIAGYVTLVLMTRYQYYHEVVPIEPIICNSGLFILQKTGHQFIYNYLLNILLFTYTQFCAQLPNDFPCLPSYSLLCIHTYSGRLQTISNSPCSHVEILVRMLCNYVKTYSIKVQLSRPNFRASFLRSGYMQLAILLYSYVVGNFQPKYFKNGYVCFVSKQLIIQ